MANPVPLDPFLRPSRRMASCGWWWGLGVCLAGWTLAMGENSLPQIVRGPYLQCGTRTNIVVRWRTDVPTTSYAAYGTNPVQLAREVWGGGLTTEHSLRLTELSPDTKYYYAVGTLEGVLVWGPSYHFVTAPALVKPIRIWAIGDSGTASAGVFGSHEVRDAYHRFARGRRTDVWLMLGDNAYSVGSDEQYQAAVFETYTELLPQTVLWSTIGNHETYASYPDGRFAYLDIFTFPERGEAGGIPSGTPYYYSFDYANVHFVCLDSEVSSRDRGGPMLNWLQEDLAANTNDWLIAFWHSPPYSMGSHNSDNPSDSGGRLFQMRTNVVPILEAHGVDLVLCGHSHNYERSYLLQGHYGTSAALQPSMILNSGSGRTNETGAYLKSNLGPQPNQGTVYVVAGSSGWATFVTGRHPAMFTQLLELGSMVIDIDGNRLDAKFLRETGAVDDYFTILKGEEPGSFKVVAIVRAPDQAVVSWNSKTGTRYQVEHTADLTPPSWTTVSDVILAQGVITYWTNALSSEVSTGYYRVRQVGD